MRNPRDIYQENLDEVAVRLWARDFDGVCEHLLVPNRIVTEDGMARVDDLAAIRQNLAHYRRTLDELDANGYHRICLDAAYTSKEGNQIRGFHRTFVLMGGTRVIPPYDCEMELLPTPHGWKAARLCVIGHHAALPVFDPAAFRTPMMTGKHP